MTNIQKYYLLSVLVLSSLFVAGAIVERHFSTVWTTEQIFDVPESVYYDSSTNTVFVSNIAGQPMEKDGNGFISKMTVEGKITDLTWVAGLNAPKGMAAGSNMLYVSDVDHLVKINIETGTIITSYAAPGAVFLNDVALGPNGIVYVSDSRKNVIYQLVNEELSIWLEGESLNNVNGLFIDGDDLIAGVRDKILRINRQSMKISELATGTGSVDGIEADGEGAYYFSNWVGKVYHVIPGHEPVLLMDTSAEKISSADIGYIPELKLVLIPTFYDNRVIAARME